MSKNLLIRGPMFIAIFAKEFGTEVSRQRIGSCSALGKNLFIPVVKREFLCFNQSEELWRFEELSECEVVLTCTCEEFQAGLLSGREEGLGVYGWQECSVALYLTNVWTLRWYMLVLALYFWTLGNDYFTITFGLWSWDWPEKAFVFLFVHLLGMEKYSIYFWLIWKFGDLGSWFPFWLKPPGLRHIDLFRGFIWERASREELWKPWGLGIPSAWGWWWKSQRL